MEVYCNCGWSEVYEQEVRVEVVEKCIVELDVEFEWEREKLWCVMFCIVELEFCIVKFVLVILFEFYLDMQKLVIDFCIVLVEKLYKV